MIKKRGGVTMIEIAFNTEKFRAYQRVIELCNFTYQDNAWMEEFWLSLIRTPEIYEEWVYYMNNDNFLGKYRISDYNIFDIYVWQVNQFKYFLSYACDGCCQGAYILLKTFDFLLKMNENPNTYIRIFEEKTGNDLY